MTGLEFDSQRVGNPFTINLKGPKRDKYGKNYHISLILSINLTTYDFGFVFIENIRKY